MTWYESVENGAKDGEIKTVFRLIFLQDYEWGEDGMAFVAVCPKCKRPELNWASI